MYDSERIKVWLTSLILRRLLPIVIVIMCLLGVALMIMGNFRQGLSLWFLSLVFGALTLYIRRTLEKKLRDLQEEMRAAAEAEATSEEAQD